MADNGDREINADAEPTTWLDGLSCTQCRLLVAPSPQLFGSYFDEGWAPCPFCKQPLDLWTQTINELKTMPASWVAFRMLGALRTNFPIKLAAGKFEDVDLTQFAPTTEFLNVSVMPISRSEGWPVMPALSLANELRLDPFPRRLRLYGLPNDQQIATDSEVRVLAERLDVLLLDLVTDPEADPRQKLIDRTRGLTRGTLRKLLRQVPATTLRRDTP